MTNINYKALASRLKTSELVVIYNDLNNSDIKKFVDRTTAVQRASDIMKMASISIEDLKKQVSNESKELLNNIPQVRTSEFSGKKVYKKVKENLFNKGSRRGETWEKIKDGMTIEDFQKIGVLADLRFMITKDRIEVK